MGFMRNSYKSVGVGCRPVVDKTENFPCSAQVLFYGCPVELGAGQNRGYDHSLQEVVGQDPEGLLDLTHPQMHLAFLQFLLQNVKGVIFVSFKQVLKGSTTDIPLDFLFLGQLQNLVKCVNLFVGAKNLPEYFVTLVLGCDEGKDLINYV